PDKDHDPTQSQDPTPAYGELAGEENLAFFYNAMEIYSWKAMGVTGFELDYSKKTTGGDTVIYTKVAGGAYDTMEKVDTLLKIYFSDPLCAEIKDGLFWETDGALYVVDAARGSDITIVGETLYLTRETDSTRTYTMVVERDEDMNGETNTLSSYVYEAQNINGTWRFTVFPFYW
ncbi:MAG TPA: hypothetical protein DCY74_04855, partial [Clostridiales bacterium]|nr:hypothetical protein [Clostridiales bacterium]